VLVAPAAPGQQGDGHGDGKDKKNGPYEFVHEDGYC
jgi:hypothetical protein